ncbi:MAG: hypothetical protein WKF77_06175 [Planctomycetaceae bacterium]
MDLIESGELYPTLAEMADMPYETDSEKLKLKRDFQCFCLFGPIGFHGLWRALQSICPGVCRDIRWWRNQAGGATRLAHMLMRAEGALLTDGLVRHMVASGIPSVQIFDGSIMPAGAAPMAEEFLKSESRRQYGRSCRVKIVS